MKRKKEKKKTYFIISIFIILMSIILSFYLTNYFDISYESNFKNVLKVKHQIYSFNNMFSNFIESKRVQLLFVFANGVIIPLCFYLVFLSSKKTKYAYQIKLFDVTDEISIPSPSGHFQHGSSWFTNTNDFEKVYNYIDLDKKNNLYGGLFIDSNKKIIEDKIINEGGIVLGMRDFKKSFLKSSKQRIFFNGDDTHTLTIGTTRSGKTRCLVLESIGLLALASENMVVSDPKGELFYYTSDFLKKLDYEVITIDFRNTIYSNQNNYLQGIIDAVNKNQISKAVELTADMANQLVGKAEGERIWHDGQISVISFSILCVVIENKDRYEYQNLTNVYFFIAEMCKTDKNGVLYIQKYFKTLPEDHPARVESKISEIAPSKTRGSFFTSALATLRLFALKNIYTMTNETDYDINDFSKKRAIFIILPDEKTTYYSLASLFVNNYYISAVNSASKIGNRLPRRLNFILDEFGNFSPIPDFSAKITVGGGYGIRFNLFLQSFKQLDSVYDEKTSITIQDNCNVLIYLKSNVTETKQSISDRLGKYTVTSTSDSTSIQGGSDKGGGSYSSSTSLIERSLLTADEIGKLKRPHSLVMTGSDKSIMYAPDLTCYDFNILFNLGDKEHNEKIMMERQEIRKKRIESERENIKLWGIWKIYQGDENEDEIVSNKNAEKLTKKIEENILEDEIKDTNDNNYDDDVYDFLI